MTYLPDERVKWIVIHYSATPIERVYTYAQLDRDHRMRGFREVGYHYYLPRAGGRVRGRDLSQPGRFEMGAHSKGENDASIGICFEGGVTLDEPNRGWDTRNADQIREMVRLIDELLVRFPNAEVIGHRDMPGAKTQCPGFDAGAWWHRYQEARASQGASKAPRPPFRYGGSRAGVLATLAALVGVLLAGIGIGGR